MSNNLKIGVYAGSFNPITIGHLDVIQKSFKIVDVLYIVVGHNSNKKSEFFSIEERLDAISKSIEILRDSLILRDIHIPEIIVTSHSGLMLDFATEKNADIIIRGLRDSIDFSYEITMATTNKLLSNNRIDTVFIPAEPSLNHVSSSAVRELVKSLSADNNYSRIYNILSHYINSNYVIDMIKKKYFK